MGSFLTIVGPYIIGFKRINIRTSYESKIQQRVLDILKLKDMGQLRDKYEGERYYTLLFEQIIGIIAVEQFLNIKIIDIENIKTDFDPTLTLWGVKIDIIISRFGEFPIIDSNPKRPSLVLLNKDDKTVYICGFASVEILSNHQRVNKSIVSNKGKSYFIGFNHLSSFNTQEELKNLLFKSVL